MTSRGMNFVTRMIILFLFLTCLIVGIKCDGLDTFHVTIIRLNGLVPPPPGSEGKALVWVHCSADIDTTTLRVPYTVIIDLEVRGTGKKVEKIAGYCPQRTVPLPRNAFLFISEKTLLEMIDPLPKNQDIIYTITLKGEKGTPIAIRDISGNVLDGDKDNKPGGDHVEVLFKRME